MNPVYNNSSRQIDWNRVFHPAIEAASRVMGVWTQGRVSLSLEEVCEIPLDALGDAVRNAQEPAVIISLGVDGDVSGRFLFALDDAGAERLVALLLDRGCRGSAEWSELERSALLETGNILGSAYLSALTNVVGMRLLPTPPEMIRDYLSCVLEQAVMIQALQSDTLLLAHTCFRHGDQRVDWNLVFVPSPELLELLRRNSEGRS